MRKCMVLLYLLLTVTLLAGELCAQRRRRRRRDGIGSKNVYELFGTLKSVAQGGKVLVVDVVDEDSASRDVALCPNHFSCGSTKLRTHMPSAQPSRRSHPCFAQR